MNELTDGGVAAGAADPNTGLVGEGDQIVQRNRSGQTPGAPMNLEATGTVTGGAADPNTGVSGPGAQGPQGNQGGQDLGERMNLEAAGDVAAGAANPNTGVSGPGTTGAQAPHPDPTIHVVVPDKDLSGASTQDPSQG